MPKLKKGTECIKLLLSQTSKDMHAPLTPMLFPILGAHVCNSQFQYPDLTWKEPTGMMANLVAESGGNKGQLSNLVEALCRDFRNPYPYSAAPHLRHVFGISSGFLALYRATKIPKNAQRKAEEELKDNTIDSTTISITLKINHLWNKYPFRCRLCPFYGIECSCVGCLKTPQMHPNGCSKRPLGSFFANPFRTFAPISKVRAEQKCTFAMPSKEIVMRQSAYRLSKDG